MAFWNKRPDPLAELTVERNKTLVKLRIQEAKAEARLLEAFTDLSDTFVDPCDALADENGELWVEIGAGRDGNKAVPAKLNTPEGLKAAQQQARSLAATNEFAIGGHENRINYVIGSGHDYKVIAKPDEEVGEEVLKVAQAAIDRFTNDNNWKRRQQEILLRKDRDGECCLRFFLKGATDGDDENEPKAGTVTVRFVEPGQVVTPQDDNRENARLGIITTEDDIETVEAYWIDLKEVPADEIQHRKANVDMNVRRGCPLFYPVRQNLRRVEKLLRNMSVVASIQAAIAMIRKRPDIDANTAADWTENNANFSVSHGEQPTTYHQGFGAGTIIDSPANTEYEFPATGIDAAKYVIVVQAELRAVASRLVMPEFMLTSDASNANYSSTLVAEGPAVKMIERLQATMIEEDTEVMDRVLDLAVVSGEISQENRDKMALDVTPPTVATRDRLQETQADAILLDKKVMSIETMQVRNDLDPESETKKIDEDREKNDPFAGMDLAAMMGGPQPPKPSGQDEEEDDDNGRRK